MKKLMVMLVALLCVGFANAFENLGFTSTSIYGTTALAPYGTAYVLATDGLGTTDYLVDFDVVTTTTDTYTKVALKYSGSGPSAAELEAYYTARGVPPPFLEYLIAAANDVNAFAYIDNVYGGLHIYDAAKLDILSVHTPMTIPGDYPCGKYTVASADSAVSFSLIIQGPQCKGFSAIGFTANGQELGMCRDGYLLRTKGIAYPPYMVTFSDVSSTDTLYDMEALYLANIVGPTVPQLETYYDGNSPDAPINYRQYLKTGLLIEDPTQTPFAYLDGIGAGVEIYDGAAFNLEGGNKVAMRVPGNYPCGEYTVETKDGTVKFTLVVDGPQCADADTVNYCDDLCPGTVADAQRNNLGTNRWIWSGAIWTTKAPGKKEYLVDWNPNFQPTIADTYGCSCTQILDRMKATTGFDFGGHYKFGCSKSILQDWNALVQLW